jgi:hypothetical protein
VFRQVPDLRPKDSDGERLRVFFEECAELLRDFSSDNN